MSSTEDYVNNAFHSREEDIAKLLAGESLEDGGDAETELDEYPLDMSVKTVLTIDISTGGPGEWIEATIDDGGYVTEATFYAVWGSTKRETRLDETDALWQWAEAYGAAVRHNG